MSDPRVATILRWYAVHRRDLPWRRSSPWGVLVSEFMLQQTPVSRVLPVWADWMARWPAPGDLAATGRAEVISAWGRLGYPRRAVRLQGAAVEITYRHGGAVPCDRDALRALPGVGDYTAAAVLAFAYGRRICVIDVNVDRVLRRAFLGTDEPVRAGDIRALADTLLPRQHARAALWSAATMELGALVCTSRRPACDTCPVRQHCAWVAAGSPPGPQRVRPRYAGSDRQARGAVLAALRASGAGVPEADLQWPDADQLARAVESLIADGLLTRNGHLLHL